MTTQMRICEWCGTEFQVGYIAPKRAATHGRFCSKSCQARWLARNRATTTGQYKTSKGYVLIYRPEHPNATKGGYVMEHRLVMENHLGRLLLPSEVVHHKNGDKSDNRTDNLEVMTKREHDKKPKPPVTTRTITCPHCGEKITVSTRAHRVRVI